MSIVSAGFREYNLARINKLASGKLSNETIAAVIKDETDDAFKITAADVGGYLKMSKATSKQVLISADAAKALLPDTAKPARRAKPQPSIAGKPALAS